MSATESKAAVGIGVATVNDQLYVKLADLITLFNQCPGDAPNKKFYDWGVAELSELLYSLGKEMANAPAPDLSDDEDDSHNLRH